MSDLAGTNILILGGGGREHAIAHALSRSESAIKLHCAPGNPGIMALAQIHDADPCDGPKVLDLCLSHGIGLVVIGPEAPLAAGVADVLRAAGIRVFGPGRAGAALESSKTFAKNFMRRHGIPTADFDICKTPAECESAISRRKPPYVIKADGLASGKGVYLPDEAREAMKICAETLSGKTLGGAGKTLVIEDFLPGRELTVFAITDGTSYRLLSPSRDHKRAFDGDRGPNTGGMGAYSPVTLPGGLVKLVEDDVLRPTLDGLRSDGIDYRGVIYMGLMIAEKDDGRPGISVVEYNVRFGDPETQAVLPLYRGDFARLLTACAEGRVDSCPDTGSAGAALCVVLTSDGYPGQFRRGLPIEGLGLEKNQQVNGAFVYHSGTALDAAGRLVTSGGRVLSAVGTGDTFAEARDRAYALAASISFEGMRYRQDIGGSEE
ncbi:MAG: phosphoribosylamine--glycine ligase [Synergistaceae bacterium]|jgi:phosphoribosylamine--glycine ligase|nr:phosphoribosylamine--glycine ligase [Synergistaceae bacterium]